VERGIGEIRSALIEGGEIVEARIMLEGVVPAGTVLDARLTQVRGPAIAVAGGQEYLLPQGAPGATEGTQLKIEVTRETIPGGEPWKRPLARVSEGAGGATLEGGFLPFPAPDDPLETAGWSDLLDEARSGIVRFAGGELRVSPTPAMTLIDVDGYLPALDLALAGAQAAARAILRHGIGGSIGVDLPTVAGKGERLRIAEAVDAILPQPFERTAVNGFGFLQIVRARRHASLFELAADRAAFEARALLRIAARCVGATRVTAPPAVIRLFEQRPEWTEALARQVGGQVRLHVDPALPMSGGYAAED
jgi:hypothetical protein